MDYPGSITFAVMLKLFSNWATDQAPLPGKYAMWWADGLLSFSDSDAHEYIDRAYRALDGIESRVYAAILHSLGALDKTVPAESLPEDLFSVYFFTQTKQPFFFSASQEKGLRFHFHTEQVDGAERDGFWMLFAEYAEAFRRRILEEPFAELAGKGESRPLDWWLLTEQSVATAESVGFSPEVVGAIVI
jgi:hypothetical protein